MKRYLLLGLLTALVCIACSSPRVTPSADGVPIHYTVQGKGSPTLVFSHCWSGDKSYWDNQVPYFSDKYQVVTLDLAGHGESDMDRKNWTMEAFGNDVVAVIQKLDLKQVVLIGHSMSGSVIIEAAKQIPDRVIGLVGVDNLQDVERTFSDEQIQGFVGHLGEDFTNNVTTWIRTMFPASADSTLVERIAADMASAPPEVALSAMKNLLAYDAQEALKELSVPIRTISSDRYPTNVEGNRQYADFDVRLMPGGGHFLQLEDPATFNNHLEAIIQEFVRMKSAE